MKFEIQVMNTRYYVSREPSLTNYRFEEFIKGYLVIPQRGDSKIFYLLAFYGHFWALSAKLAK